MSAEKLQKLVDAWKGVEFEGAELIFNHSTWPEMNPNYEWPAGMKYRDLPQEAFTGEMEDIWSVGWKATIDGDKYGNYLLLTEPTGSEDIVTILRKNYESSRKEIESRTRRA